MNQKDLLLLQIGSLEGRVITPELARQARGLAGATVDTQASLAIESMKSQLLIMFLRDLGGEKTYTIEQIDDEPSAYNMALQQRDYHNKPAFTFKLIKK